MWGIGGISFEEKGESILESSSSFHEKLPISPTEQSVSPLHRPPPLIWASAEFRPRMRENQSSNRAQVFTRNCRYLQRKGLSRHFAGAPPNVGIGGIKSENERKSSPKSSSTLHYKLPITHRESISRRFAASPPLCGVSAEFSPRMKENQSSNRAQLCTTNCRYLHRESVSPRFAASPMWGIGGI